MRRTPTYEDATPAGAVNGSEHTTRREPTRAGTLTLIARAAAHDRISAALRSARERAALDEQQVIDLMRARGVSISVATLERWERTGGIRLEEAVDLAAVYHMSLDELAGRRAWHSRFLGSVERTRLAA
jgi:hypothetical protein